MFISYNKVFFSDNETTSVLISYDKVFFSRNETTSASLFSTETIKPTVHQLRTF